MSQHFADNIKYLRTKHNMTQEQLADYFGITKAGVSSWEKGRSEPNFETLLELAKIFNVSTESLVGSDNKIYEDCSILYITVPLYSPICCGNGGFNDDEIISCIAVPSDSLSPTAEYFAQVAKGDSMIDAGIFDGDLLVFEKTSQINSGEIGCFCIDYNEAVCKKFVQNDNMMILKAMNSAYDPIFVDPSLSHFACLGKLKLSIKKF